MTCIAGLVANGSVYICGDSAGVSGLSISTRRDPKVFKTGKFVMGFTTSFRMGQLLAHSLSVPDRHPSKDIYAFMVTDFIDAVRTCLKNGGYATKNAEAEAGGNFLVGYEGRLFEVYSDYQVGENIDGVAACGCGFDLALGALFATEGQPPEKRLITALSAAEKYSAGVCGPFTIEKL